MKRAVGMVVGAVVGIVALAWAAGPTALQVKFKLPPATNKVKPTAIVDGDGNVLFNGTTPGRVAVVNALSGPSLPSQMLTVSATLACPFGNGGEQFAKISNPDGTLSDFAIPSGQVFVITSWSVVGGVGVATPGHAIQVQLHVGNGYSVAIQNADASASGNVSFHQTFPTGIVAASGTPICVWAFDLSGASNVGVSGIIHGYLTDAG